MCSCLAQEPDKIIYIGRNARQMEEFIARCRTIFRSEIVFECRKADFQNLDKLTELLTGIVETEPACAFDLTGGPDLALVAMGIVAERCREKHIQMHRFSPDRRASDCDEGPAGAHAEPDIGGRIEHRINAFQRRHTAPDTICRPAQVFGRIDD